MGDFILFIYLFIVGLEFGLKVLYLKAGSLLLEPHLQPILPWLF
jgi:hypothetical protein